MQATWRTLHRAGLPLAGAREGVAPSVPEIAAGVLALRMSGDGGPREREALAAFVLAWADQWPTSFRQALGAESDPTVAWAEALAPDPDRRIKLRRIAMENLSHVL